MSTFAIIGSGISGCTAGLQIVQAGHRAIVIEKDNKVGGKVVSFCCKAIDECQKCGVCVANEIIADTIRHPDVTTLSSTQIVDVKKQRNKLSILVQLPPVHISYSRCVLCDRCITACPEGAITKMISCPVVQYIVDTNKCLRSIGRRCTRCQFVCPVSAIKLNAHEAKEAFVVDGVIVAIGHSVFDPRRKPIFLYGTVPNVFTAAEAEKILVERNYLVKPGENIAFIQCVGSRDAELGLNYCSAVCCGYAVRIANLINYNCQESHVTVYYIDLQSFDKTFATQRQKLIKDGVKLVRAMPFDMVPLADGKIAVHVESDDGHQTVKYDAVVLSTGISASVESAQIAKLFGLGQNEFGFISGSLPYVYASGTCVQPQSIADCISSARAVAYHLIASDNVKQKPHTYSEVVYSEVSFPSNRLSMIPVSKQVLVIGRGVSARTVSEGLKSVGLVPISTDNVGMVTGNIGAFNVKTSDGKVVKCGAIVVADDVELPQDGLSAEYGGRVLFLNELENSVFRYAKAEKVLSVGIILDMKRDESSNSTRIALQTALNIITRLRCETYLLCHDLRVAGDGIELLHAQARNAGVIIVKYDGLVQLGLEKGSTSDIVSVDVFDSILRRNLKLRFDFVGISSFGMGSGSRIAVAELLRCGVDFAGYLQENNIRYFPEITKRPGVFVIGASRGQHEPMRVREEAMAVCFRIAMLLGAGRMAVSRDTAVVDAQKCALCLTCVRVCPHTAMVIDEERRSAKSLPEACLRCGICVSHCPAKAITLPGEKL